LEPKVESAAHIEAWGPCTALFVTRPARPPTTKVREMEMEVVGKGSVGRREKAGGDALASRGGVRSGAARERGVRRCCTGVRVNRQHR